MRTLPALLIAVAMAAAAHGAPDPGGFIVTDGVDEAVWSPLIEALGGKGPIQASFTERRYFSIRKEPTVLKGVIRVSPERGLSLQYIAPEPLILVADPQGLILRRPNGRDREMPAGSREAGAMASLLPVMRFDVPALLPLFLIRASGNPFDWRFEFTPRDAAASKALGTIVVRGRATDVTNIEFRRSGSQRIEIEVGETRTGVVFTPDELRRYFRRPGSH